MLWSPGVRICGQVLQEVGRALAASCFTGAVGDSQQGKRLQKVLFEIRPGAVLGFDRFDFIQEQADVAADTLHINFSRELEV
jgi:hypothetical protein